jgi:hypothetical protein
MSEIQSIQVEFYEPLTIQFKEAPNKLQSNHNIELMLTMWKQQHLNTESTISIWNRLHINKKKNQLKAVLRITKGLIKTFWPLLILATLANYLSILSTLFLSLILIPLQLIVLARTFLKIYEFACVASAFILEQKIKKYE